MDSILDELNIDDPVLKFVIMLNERVGCQDLLWAVA